MEARPEGNPAGRRSGTGDLTKLRAAILEHMPGIIATPVQKAKEGDAQAARLLLERALRPVKPVALLEPLPLPPGSLAERGEALLRAVAAGEASPDAAAPVLDGLAALARLKAVDDLEARLRRLEERNATDARHTETPPREA